MTTEHDISIRLSGGALIVKEHAIGLPVTLSRGRIVPLGAFVFVSWHTRYIRKRDTLILLLYSKSYSPSCNNLKYTHACKRAVAPYSVVAANECKIVPDEGNVVKDGLFG